MTYQLERPFVLDSTAAEAAAFGLATSRERRCWQGSSTAEAQATLNARPRSECTASESVSCVELRASGRGCRPVPRYCPECGGPCSASRTWRAKPRRRLTSARGGCPVLATSAGRGSPRSQERGPPRPRVGITRGTWQTWLVGEMAQAEPSQLPGRINGLVTSGLEILTRRRFATSPKSFLTVLPCSVHRPAWARWGAHQAPDGFGLGTHNDLGARSTDVKLRVPRTFLELSSLGSLPA